MLLEHAPRTRMLLPTLACLLGGGMVLGGRFLIDQTTSKFLYFYAQTLHEVSGDASFLTSSNGVFGVLAGGGLAIFAGLIGCLGSALRIRFVYYLFFVLAFAGALAMLVGGGMFMNSIPHLSSYTGNDKDAYFVGNPNSKSFAKLNTVQQGLLDYNIAIFNECCWKKSWRNTNINTVCTGDNEVDCPAILNPLVKKFIDPSLLCTCASKQSSLDAYTSALKNNGICDLMTNIYVDLSSTDTKIPSLPFSLASVIKQQFPNAILTNVPLVGFQDDLSQFADEFPDVSPKPASGFGCGVGFSKGIMWYVLVWHSQKVGPIALLGLGLGASLITVLVFGICFGILEGREERNDGKQHMEDIPAGYMMTVPAPQQTFEVVMPGFAEVKNASPHVSMSSGISQGSAAKTTQIGTTLSHHSAQSGQSEVANKLRDFYNKYEPGKPEADVQDVAAWALANGVEKLNQKLMSKYQADLNTFSAAPGVKGIGMRAMAADIDL